MEKSEKKWRVLYVKPRSEKQALLSLSKLGIEAYLPLQRQVHKWSDRKKIVEVVLFPSYVFVRTDFTDREFVFNSVYVIKYVYLGSKEALLSEADIKLLSKSLEKLEIGDKGFEIGTQVLIESGNLMGLCGEVIKNKEEFSVRVKISGLSCYIRSRINISDLQVLI